MLRQTSSSSTMESTMEVGGSTSIPLQTLASSETLPISLHDIQTLDHLPSATSRAIPLIDLSISSAADIAGVSRDWGAFQVVNHGVPIKLLDEMRTVGSSFFNIVDVSEKLKCGCDTRNFDHLTSQLSRWKTSIWPDYPQNHRILTGQKVVEEYSAHMKMLAQKLLSLISESLGLQSSCIEATIGEFYQNITVSCYAPCPHPDVTLGLQSHSDMGAITLLIQDDAGGLEVLKDGEWVNVPPLSDAIVVILGDQTEIITNGEYKSGIHRVVNANRVRFSVATFHEPAKTRTISPAPGLTAKSGHHFRVVLFRDFAYSCHSKIPEGKRSIDVFRL